MRSKKIKSIVSFLALAAGIVLFTPSSVSAAWRQDKYGWWNTEGTSYSIGWRNINNAWYYFDSNGYMKTGWANVNGTWYYLHESGAMRTGWINTNNTWYYLNDSGDMRTGWINDKGTWYYADKTGAMQTGLLTINDNTYYLNQSGAMTTGDVIVNGIKYTFASTGEKISSTIISNNSSTVDDSIITDFNSDKVASGGGGGSIGNTSTDKNDNSTFQNYSDLYGNWQISSYIENSGMTTNLPGLIINSAIGEKFTVTNKTISSSLGNIANPTVKESILNNSEFSQKFGTSLSKLGISGDKVNCITVSGKDSSNSTKTGYIITDSKNSVYAIAKGAAFKLKKA